MEEEKERPVFIVFTVPAGLVDRVIKVEVHDEIGLREELKRTVKPSEKINLDFKVLGDARMEIFLDEELVEERELKK